MSPTPPAIQNLARQLLAGEQARGESAHGDSDYIVRVCGKLRVPLSKLAGAAGFSSLLSRALALARRQAPSLEKLRVGADGSLMGFEAIQGDSDAAEAARHGGLVLLAELLGLLVTFIGQPLTLRLVHEAWPDLSLENMSVSTKEKP
jgi:hypothetical protein